MKERLFATILAASLGLGTSGCIKEALLNGQIEGTRKASAGVDTLSDYEVANSIAFAGLGQFEGMHYLAPENEDALFLLTKSWTGVAFGFIEDVKEQAEDAEGADSPLATYQKARAKAAYDRAIHYGVELLEQKNAGFEAAKKNDDTIKRWLAAFNDPEHDAPNLFWTASAWMSRVNLLQDEPAMVSELFVGVAMMERAVQLNDGIEYGMGHAALGSYHGRPMGEADEAKKEFDKALAISKGKYLLVQFNEAAKLFCIKGDKDGYVKTMTEIVDAGDVLPEKRLQNTIAKRRAKRYLSPARMKACGF